MEHLVCPGRLLPGARQPAAFLKCKLICGGLVEPFVDSSSNEVFHPKGREQNTSAKSAGTVMEASAWICLYLSQGKQSALGGLGVSRTPWSHTKQTIPQVCLQNRLSISVLSCTKCLSNLSR